MPDTADRLFAPLSSAEFLERCWPYEAAALPPDPRRTELFPSLTSLPIDQLIRQHPNPIHAVGSDNEDGSLTTIPDSAAGARAFASGQSLCLAGAHVAHDEVHRVLDALIRTVGLTTAQSQCNAYVSPAGEGVPWHFDDREVLVIQLQGSKRWTLAANHEIEFPTENFVLATGAPSAGDELALYAPGRVAGPSEGDCREVLMTPGSVVFMPRGTWHRTVADEPSLSLTFGLFTPTVLDVLLQQMRSACVRDARYRRPLSVASETQRGRTERELGELFAPWRGSVAAGVAHGGHNGVTHAQGAEV